MEQKYFHYCLKMPNGWRYGEYRVFPREESEAKVDRDWRCAVSECAADVYDIIYADEDDINSIPDLETFIEDALLASYAEEISEQEYLDGVWDQP